MRKVISADGDSFRVTFLDEKKRGVPDYIEVLVNKDKSITVRGVDGTLSVHPVVGNMVTIKLEAYV